jgi:hypothetical protein
MKIILVITFLASILSPSLKAQENISIQDEFLVSKFREYQSGNHFKKLYLHTDREKYTSGQNIWFSAYLVDALSHNTDPGLTNLYIHLYDISGKTRVNKIFRFQNGNASGNILLEPGLPDGNYVLYAFTDPMVEGNPYAQFTRPLYIANESYKNSISKQEIEQNLEFNNKLNALREKVEMKCYPEGGKLIAGVPNRVIVKVSDGTGNAVIVSGQLRTSSNSTLQKFVTSENGLATVSFTPEAQQTYSCIIDIPGKNPLTGYLPAAISNDAALSVTEAAGDSIEVQIKHNLSNSKSLILIAQCRGKLVYSKSINTEEITFRFSKNNLPTGVVQFSLLNEDYRTLSDRMVFINRDDQIYIDLAARAVQKDTDRILNMRFTAIDGNDLPVEGTFSISILAGKVEPGVESDGIFRHFFLASDISWNLPVPASCLLPDNPEGHAELDKILIASNYAWHNPADKQAAPTPLNINLPSRGLKIQGKILDSETNQPVKQAEVNLRTGLDPDNVHSALTNENGSFCFSDLYFTDSTAVYITTPGITGNKTTVVITPGDEPIYEYLINAGSQTQRIFETGKEWKKTKPPSAVRSKGSSSPYGMPDQTITPNEKVAYTSMITMLQEKAVGLMISGNSIMFRGPSSIMFSSEPMFIRDHVMVTSSDFLSQDPREIEKIELFRGASTAFFGARGANGVIISYSKRGKPVEKNSFTFYPAGYSVPQKFYVNEDIGNLKPGDGNSSTLYWEAPVKTSKNGQFERSVYLVPGITKYKIVIEGTGNNEGIAFGEYIIGK